MILESQPFSEFVSVRGNSWLTHLHMLQPPPCPSFPPSRLCPCALVPCALPPFVSWCLRGYASIMQNEPNFQNPQNATTLYATKTYRNIPLRPAPKNEPKQTQSRDTQYAARCTLHAMRNKPNSPPGQSSIQHPASSQYALRHTLHASRHTNPVFAFNLPCRE